MGRRLREMSSAPDDTPLPWDPVVGIATSAVENTGGAVDVVGDLAEIAAGGAVTARDAAGIVPGAVVPARQRSGRGRHAADPEPPGGSGNAPGVGWRGNSGTSWVGMAPAPVAFGTAGPAGVAFCAPELRSPPREVRVSERRAARASERERQQAAQRERIRSRAQRRSQSLLVNPRASEQVPGRVPGKAAGGPDSGAIGADENAAGRRPGAAQPRYGGLPTGSQGGTALRSSEPGQTAEAVEVARLPVRPRCAPERFPARAHPVDRPDVDTLQRVLVALRRL